MELTDFAQDYAELQPGEQAVFADTVRKLLADGMIWRQDDKDRRTYAFLQRYRDLVSAYLAVAGWELNHNELLGIFRVSHRDGAHRRRLHRDATIWILLLRLLYAEKREQAQVMATPNPVVQVSEIIQRYTAFFPGQVVRKKTSLQDALRAFSTMKLVRLRHISSSDPTVELLPTLEEIIPAKAIDQVAARLEEFTRPDEDGHEPESKSETEGP